MARRPYIGIVLVIIILVLLTYSIQIPIPYNHTLNAFKIDANGNLSGTVQITLIGTKYLSIFHKTLLIVNIQEFDNHSGFTVNSNDYKQFLDEEFLHNTFVVSDIGSVEDMLSENYTLTSNKYNVCLSKDFECWLIHVSTSAESEVYYLASINEKHSFIELAEYFKSHIPR